MPYLFNEWIVMKFMPTVIANMRMKKNKEKGMEATGISVRKQKENVEVEKDNGRS